MSKLGDAMDVHGRRFRERLSRFIPYALTNYPFEVLAAFVGLFIGLPLLLGLAAPTSLVVLLPNVGYWIYASTIVLGASTIGLGLHFRNSMAVASGLQLLGGSFLIYGLAVVALSGFAVAWLSFGAYTIFGVLSWVRALHFRRLLDIQKGATSIRNQRTREGRK